MAMIPIGAIKFVEVPVFAVSKEILGRHAKLRSRQFNFVEEDSDVLYLLQIVEAVAPMKKCPYLSISH
jgi:hypothetical protein